MYNFTAMTPVRRLMTRLALMAILFLSAGGIAWSQQSGSLGNPARIDSSRVRVVNMSPQTASIIVESGSFIDTIANVAPMSASRSTPVMFGALHYRTRVGSSEWSPQATALVRHESINTILFSSGGAAGISVSVYERMATREQDSLSGNPTPRVDQGQIRLTLVPHGTATYQAEVLRDLQKPGIPFSIRPAGAPEQESPIVNLDPGVIHIDIHGATGFPMLDRIRLQGERAGERHRIIVESRSDSTFDAWRYNELDSNAQSLVAGEHLTVGSIEGKVRLVSLSFSNMFVGRITPNTDTLNIGYRGTSRWINSTGGRLVLDEFGSAVERYNDTFGLGRKGLTSLVIYDNLFNGSGLGVVTLHTFPHLGRVSGLPALRFANATGETRRGSFQVKREGQTVARFDSMAVDMVLPYQRLETSRVPNEFSLYSSESGGAEPIAQLTLPVGSYTTVIVSTSLLLAGARSSDRAQQPAAAGSFYIWALQEFPDDSTTSALTLLSFPTAVRDEPAVERARIWPNPSRGTLSIHLESAAPLAGSLVATDMHGRTVADFGEQRVSAGGTTIDVDLSGLASGVYTLSIVEKGGRRVFVGRVTRR